MADLEGLNGNRYRLDNNVDGYSWAYEVASDQASLRLQLERVICGEGKLSNGLGQCFGLPQLRLVTPAAD